MTAHEWQSLPLDGSAQGALAAGGLAYRLVDTSDADSFGDFLQAGRRGFLAPDLSAEQLSTARDGLAYRRTTAVYDETTPNPTWPVGTINSWITELTLPGSRGIPMWAVSEVSVAATHRRRGIARSLIEGELRTAVDAGVPIAGLTVTEATIYARFGYTPAAFVTDWTIETARVGWIGPRTDGNIDFIDRERLAAELPALHERVRRHQPGDVGGWPGLWWRISGTGAGQESTRGIRAVRYADTSGRTRGIAVYRLSEAVTDFTKHELTLLSLMSETPEAYAALWRFVLEHDLVNIVRAPLRSVDEPLRWMITDHRAATVTTREHHWLRVLDVARTLVGRRYHGAGECVLRVGDPLGFADGTWMLRIDADGNAEVEASSAPAQVTLGVEELGSILLGGVRVRSLYAAGRIQGSPEDIAALDRHFAPIETPWLGFWY